MRHSRDVSRSRYYCRCLWLLLFTAALGSSPVAAQETLSELDRRVQAFLDSRRGTWRDLNVPEVDGRTLRDLIVEKGFKNALEIGTSTGHSTIWIAWGMSKGIQECARDRHIDRPFNDLDRVGYEHDGRKGDDYRDRP